MNGIRLFRYELNEGELIQTARPAYKHNRVMKKLLVELELHLRKNPIGEAQISENLYAIPDIAAEVPSPGETPRMIHRKLKQYFDAGVKEVWLIDPECREVEVWTGPQLPRHELTDGSAITSPLLPGFALPLEELFS